MSYEPPQHGSACWVKIPSTDVARAKQFYSQVFGWNFRPATEHHPEDRVAKFSYPDSKLSMLGGGIVKVEPEKINHDGGSMVYIYVNNLEETLAKIQDAGGKEIGKQVPEATSGVMQHFEDTEGNYCGLYTMKK